MSREISNTDDTIDICDVIARVEELESERETLRDALDEATLEAEKAEATDTETGIVQEAREALEEFDSDPDGEELKKLSDLLSDLCGYGGDEQWRGDWYPLTLIHRSYFVEYCEDLVKDIGDMPKEIPSYIEIDWKATADNLEADYSTVDFDGQEYLYR